MYPAVINAREENGEKMLRIHGGLTLRLEKSSVVADELPVKSFDGDREVITVVSTAR